VDKFEIWNKRVAHYLSKGMRKGQSYMNALSDVDKDLYKEWTSKEWDCFYLDIRCENFETKLVEVWGL
jgi:hypothetical protein